MRALRFLAVPALALFLLVSPRALHAANGAPAASDAVLAGSSEDASYVLGNENLVQIKIFGDASVQSLYRIDELGFVNHSLAGRIRLAGLTVVAAEDLIESKLAGDYYVNPQVTVFVVEHSHFSIIGEVRKPGTYEILGRVTVVEAISTAGGFTNVANMRDVKIQRKAAEGGVKTIKIDTVKFTDQGDMHSQVYIEADDVLVIPKSFF